MGAPLVSKQRSLFSVIHRHISFDSASNLGCPSCMRCMTYLAGVGEVIKGWDLGVEGMRVGDKRHLTIPAQLAYGSSGVRGTIPPNATLEFDVQLVDVK